MKRRHAESSDQQVMMDHIRELQKRLLVCVVVLAAAGFAGYLYYEQIFAILRTPLGADLYYSSPSGSFSFVMKICAMVGITVALPVIIYNLIMFLRPAFTKTIGLRQIFGLTIGSVGLAAAGAAFGYLFIVPSALHFFEGFQVDGLSALITADSYLGFVINVIITFVIVFQIPLVMTLIDRIKPITPRKLFSMEKYVILGGLIISLFVPFAMDLTTSLLIALPIVALYNISIVAIVWQHALARRHERRAALSRPTDLTVDDSIFSDMFPEAALATLVDDEKPSVLVATDRTVSRAGMEIRRVNKVAAQLEQQSVEEKRAKYIAERESRRAAVPQALKLISDIR